MDPFLRLTIWLSRLSRRRWSRAQLIVAMAVLLVCVAIGLVEWLGYWPAALRVNRGGLPRVQNLR